MANKTAKGTIASSPKLKADVSGVFILPNCCSGAACTPLWTVTKSVTNTPPTCVMPGDSFDVDYSVTVDRLIANPSISWQANFTIVNPGPDSATVTPTAQLSGTSGGVTSNIGLPVQLLPPVMVSPGLYTGSISGSAQLSQSCDSYTEFQVTLSLPEVQPPQPCPAVCTFTVDCSEADDVCYCLYDTLTTSGISPQSFTLQSVTNSSPTSNFPVGGPVNPIQPVCESDFAAGQTQLTFSLVASFEITPVLGDDHS